MCLPHSTPFCLHSRPISVPCLHRRRNSLNPIVPSTLIPFKDINYPTVLSLALGSWIGNIQVLCVFRQSEMLLLPFLNVHWGAWIFMKLHHCRWGWVLCRSWAVLWWKEIRAWSQQTTLVMSTDSKWHWFSCCALGASCLRLFIGHGKGLGNEEVDAASWVVFVCSPSLLKSFVQGRRTTQQTFSSSEINIALIKIKLN